MKMRPAVGDSSPAIIRSVVVLPQPDGPRMVVSVPRGTAKLMWSTTIGALGNGPYRLLTSRNSMPCAADDCFTDISTFPGNNGIDTDDLPCVHAVEQHDLGAHRLGNLSADRQPQPHPALPCRKRLEQPLPHGVVNARAFVPDQQLAPPGAVAQQHPQPPMHGRVVDGVG